MRKLETKESLRLLGSVPFGRVVFSQNAMPAIRPVNHIVDNGAVVIRTHLGAAVLSSVGMVVAYEADAIDPETQLGWSVVMTGFAHRVRRPDDLLRYEEVLRPWVAREMSHVIRIQPESITGYELVEDAVRGAASA